MHHTVLIELTPTLLHYELTLVSEDVHQIHYVYRYETGGSMATGITLASCPKVIDPHGKSLWLHTNDSL